jgi:hypothetical protein
LQLSSGERGQQLAAGIFATPAGFGADAAVFVMTGVPVTFCPAEFASRSADLELETQQVPICLGLPREHLPCGKAYVGAVQVEPDAADEHVQLLLAETGISAGGATLSAAITFFNTPYQGLLIHLHLARVGLYHILSMHHNQTSYS